MSRVLSTPFDHLSATCGEQLDCLRKGLCDLDDEGVGLVSVPHGEDRVQLQCCLYRNRIAEEVMVAVKAVLLEIESKDDLSRYRGKNIRRLVCKLQLPSGFAPKFYEWRDEQWQLLKMSKREYNFKKSNFLRKVLSNMHEGFMVLKQMEQYNE